MAKVNKAPLTLSFSLQFSPFFSHLLCLFPFLSLSSPLSLPPCFSFLPSLPPPSIHLTLLLSPLSLISPLQPFSGLYREGSNLRFILPPISNLRDPCCWRRIFRGPDVSRPVKLKSVKNGKIFQWLPMFIEQQDQNTIHVLYTEYASLTMVVSTATSSHMT